MSNLAIVDNSCPPRRVAAAHTAGAMHFGKLLAQLRSSRGMTQQSLAEQSGLSLTSVQRGESSEACPFRRSNATSILHALDAVVPLSAQERADYLKLAGLEAFARIAAEYEARRLAEVEESKRRVSESADTFDTLNDPELTTALEWLWRLAEHIGTKKALDALRTAASLANLDLPAEIGASEKYRPFWTRAYLTQKAIRQPSLPVIEGATKVVHPSGSVEYVPSKKGSSDESRQRRTS